MDVSPPAVELGLGDVGALGDSAGLVRRSHIIGGMK
jgi:hypothetical protein